MRSIETECPACETEQEFRRSASTTLHLGEKVKWYCSECYYGIVRINGIDTSKL